MNKVMTLVEPAELVEGETAEARHLNGSLITGEFGNCADYTKGWGEITGLSTYMLHRAGYKLYALRDPRPLPTTPGSVIKAEVDYDESLILVATIQASGNSLVWGNYDRCVSVGRIEAFEVIFEAPEEV